MFPCNLFARWTPASARERLRKGRVPAEMRVAGHLDLANSGWLTGLPRAVEAESIDVSDCARLGELPEVVKCSALDLQRTHVKSLPAGLNVSQRIDATDCEYLSEVGALRVSALILRGCLALGRLSDGLQVRHLDLSQCGRLAEVPASTARSLWDLDVSDCQSLKALPAGLVQLRTLNVRGCTNLHALPDDIRVLSRIEVADSGLESLPESVRSTQIVWQAMRVPYRIAFHPETITVREILREPNVELRRVMLERVGRLWFYENARPLVVDSDSDAGGMRRLLRVPFGEEEDFVCLEVRCPSTGRKYLLRVPPQLSSCARAAAWLAGFSNARTYRPVVET
jgi:hypothetical protein